MAEQYSIPIYKVTLVRESGIPAPKEEVITPEIAARVALSYLEGADREIFCVMMLDGRNHPIGLNTVSIGTLSAAVIHPERSSSQPSLPTPAPSSSFTTTPLEILYPSPEDVELFSRIREAGRLLGIKIHDAIIIGHEEHYSWTSACNFTLSE